MKNNKGLVLAALYSTTMLFILIVCVFRLSGKSETVTVKEIVTEIETEWVYVEVTKENLNIVFPETTETEKPSFYTVKEYFERIGVFNEEGILVDVIDVYVKTLPKADRDQLGEGIEIYSERALRSLIEDYTG